MSIRVAVDVGGTFTDLVAYDERSREFIVLKVSSTPEQPEVGVIRALEALLSKGVKAEDVSVFLHVGTVGTNLFRGQLRLSLPRAALITTEGMRDVLEIGRQNRPELYNVFFERPEPLIPRNLRLEVAERIDAFGNVVKPIDQNSLNNAILEAGRHSVETVAICFLNSYRNPEHERVAREAVSRELGVYVCASYEVDREHREYERCSTTVVNAILMPVVSKYMEKLQQELRRLSVSAPIYVVSSSGGLLDVNEAVKRPVAAVESGPAAGVVGAAVLSRVLGLGQVLSFDMGGTTAKASAVVGHEPQVLTEIELGGKAHAGRLIKGSGYPVRTPAIDLAEVSAGGGTIIWTTPAGGLEVGPISAGASPGPACYGAGGEEPTITDANLVLGRLGEKLLDGGLMLRRDLAERALARVADGLGMEVAELAAASLRILNLHMARAVRLVSVERGLDPSRFAMIAFGGAGPMHAAELAEELNIPHIVIPSSPGLFSAYGLVFTDFRYDYVSAHLAVLDEDSHAELENAFRELESMVLQQLEEKGFKREAIILSRVVDMRYLGQGYELLVPAPREITRAGLRSLVSAFHEKHKAMYGYSRPEERVETTAIRIAAYVQTSKPELIEHPYAGEKPQSQALKEKRQTFFRDNWLETPVYDRSRLKHGNVIEGPAIIEQYDSTTIIPMDWRAEIDKHHNIHLIR